MRGRVSRVKSDSRRSEHGADPGLHPRPMSILHRWLWLILFAPCLASGQGAEVKTDEVRAELVVPRTGGRVARQAALARPADPACARVAHLLGEPGRFRPRHHLELGAARRHVCGSHRMAHTEAPAGRAARQLRVRRDLAAAGARHRGAGLPRRVVRREAACGLAGLQGDVHAAIRRVQPARAVRGEHRGARGALRAGARKAAARLASGSVRATVDTQALALDIAGLPAELRGKAIHFFAGNAGVIDHAAPVSQRWDGERLLLRVPLSAQRSDSPETMHAVVSDPAGTQGVRDALCRERLAADRRHRGSPAKPATTAPSGVRRLVAGVAGLRLCRRPAAQPHALRLPGAVAEGAGLRQPRAGSPAARRRRPGLHLRRGAVVRRPGRAAARVSCVGRPARLGLPVAIAGSSSSACRSCLR